jgi:hypothetical protein
MRIKLRPITCLAVPFAAGILVAAAISFPVISAPAPDSKVEIDNFAFSPERIPVKAGTTVAWLNADDAPHTGRLVEQAVQVEGARHGRQLLVHVHHARCVRSMLIERSKSARARPVTAGAAMAQTTSEHASAAAVRGMPVVQSTGVIELQGHQIRLYGVEGVRGHPVRELRRYLGRREVVCEPINEHRCRVDDQDLSRVVLFNGGGRATTSATPNLRSLEEQARMAHVGIRARQDDDDDDD